MRKSLAVSTVLIRGEGVAACCCARLLGEAGVAVTLENAPRPKLPAIMLGEMGQKLFTDVFDRRDLFRDLPRVRKRFVTWGDSSGVLAIPHSAVVVSEEKLLARIQSPPLHDAGAPEWTIFTTRPAPPPSREHHFGSRLATASEVRLSETAEAEACWVESVESGWLFLLPASEGRGWLLSVGGSASALLDQSRLVCGQIEELVGQSGEFPSHPRILDPLGEANWLACGTAALGFDPLCGDGAGYSTREAILAAAVIRRAIDGGDAASLLDHYRARLVGGLKRHLEVCREFYRTGNTGPWWDEQRNAVERGLDWCVSRLNGVSSVRYRLNGFSLEPID